MTQPDPYRRFAGAASVQLDVYEAENGLRYESLYDGGVPVAVPDHDSLSRLMYFGLALSARKYYRDQYWSLRVNPSSGNLHSVECYLATDALGDACLYHYAAESHALTQRARFDDSTFARLNVGLPGGSFLLGLSYVPWRESWKYGVRAYRYCQQDLGHALGALRFSAALLGWRIRLLPEVTDTRTQAVMGLDRDDAWHEGEREWPALMAAVVPTSRAFDASRWRFPDQAVPARWFGHANQLSRTQRDWRQIDAVASACERDQPVVADSADPPVAEEFDFLPSPHSAHRVIRRRRSAVDMDERATMPRRRFYQMLMRVMPSAEVSPFDVFYWRPQIQLGLLVHRVDDLSPGLYVLMRDREQMSAMRDVMRSEFLWQTPKECPAGLPLYQLSEGDTRQAARTVCCGQAIASDGIFAAAMLGHFEPTLKQRGASFYRNLFWEAGLIGQVLYLDAEAAGIGATGIGCYFDEMTHREFGLTGRSYVSLYHFTVGGPLEDPRLTTQPAYADRA